MALYVPLAALEKGVVRLTGRLTPEELGIDLGNDPCLRVTRPIEYDLSIEKTGNDLFLDGWVETLVDCTCVRCLEPFQFAMRLDPWDCVLPLEGEDAPPIQHESVDLTPRIREDSLLALPQHPLCRPDCQGVALQEPDSKTPQDLSDEKSRSVSAWSVLDQLNLE